MGIDVRKNMKAEINNENRRKFEALYFGQDVFWSCREPMEKTNILDARKLARPFSKYDAIELKPLSLISDEDRKVGIEFIEKVLPVSEKFAILFTTDFFRSRGYAVPWMALSVEEMVQAGWIKLVQ